LRKQAPPRRGTEDAKATNRHGNLRQRNGGATGKPFVPDWTGKRYAFFERRREDGVRLDMASSRLKQPCEGKRRQENGKAVIP
jgi:hypothetical protein